MTTVKELTVEKFILTENEFAIYKKYHNSGYSEVYSITAALFERHFDTKERRGLELDCSDLLSIEGRILTIIRDYDIELGLVWNIQGDLIASRGFVKPTIKILE